MSCESYHSRAGALTSGVLGFSALQAGQNAVVLGLMACRSNPTSFDFFLGETEALWAPRVLELIGSLWAWSARLALSLGGFAVGFGEARRCFLVVVVDVGEVSRERLRLTAGVGEREFLVVGAIVSVSSRMIVECQVHERWWRAVWDSL
jgi:hypothetical protein